MADDESTAPLGWVRIGTRSISESCSDGSSEVGYAYAYENNKTTQSTVGLQPRLQIGLCLVSVLSTIISISSVVTVTVFGGDIFHKSSGKQSDNVACVPCSSLLSEKSTHNTQFNLVKKNGTIYCCAKSMQSFQNMLQQYVERKILEEQVKVPPCRENNKTCSGQNSYPRPAAHLLGTRQIFQSSTGTDFSKERPLIKWTHRANLAFTKYVKYQETRGRLTIQSTGYYVVYSHLSFQEFYHGDKPMSTRKTYFSHTLYRYNPLYPNGGSEVLLRDRKTHCWSSDKEYTFQSSHLSGTFYLRAGDQIYVMACNASSVSIDPRMTYFGLFGIH